LAQASDGELRFSFGRIGHCHQSGSTSINGNENHSLGLLLKHTSAHLKIFNIDTAICHQAAIAGQQAAAIYERRNSAARERFKLCRLKQAQAALRGAGHDGFAKCVLAVPLCGRQALQKISL
jgi:hypothetical protein